MKNEYDFSSASKNPYNCKAGIQLTLTLDAETADFFMTQARLCGLPCEELICYYLSDCAEKKRQLSLT